MAVGPHGELAIRLISLPFDIVSNATHSLGKSTSISNPTDITSSP